MYNDDLDELLEEAYLEGYYDGYEDDYYEAVGDYSTTFQVPWEKSPRTIKLSNDGYVDPLSPLSQKLKISHDEASKPSKKSFSKKTKIGAGVVGGGLLAGGGYALYKHNKKKKEMIEALKNPRFRRQHPELVKKYRKALIKQGIIEEAADYYDDIIDTDYYEVY